MTKTKQELETPNTESNKLNEDDLNSVAGGNEIADYFYVRVVTFIQTENDREKSCMLYWAHYSYLEDKHRSVIRNLILQKFNYDVNDFPHGNIEPMQ